MVYKFKINLSFCSGIDLWFLCTSSAYQYIINSYVQSVHIMCSCCFMHLVHWQVDADWCTVCYWNINQSITSFDSQFLCLFLFQHLRFFIFLDWSKFLKFSKEFFFWGGGGMGGKIEKQMICCGFHDYWVNNFDM